MIIEEKIQEQPEISHKYYEIYEEKDMTAVDGSTVKVKSLIETVSKNQVESRIKDRENQIERLEEANTRDNEILTEINN